MSPPPPPPDREEIDHVAYGRDLFVCLRCGFPNALDPTRPAERQHCTSCGRRLAKRRKKRKWYKWFTDTTPRTEPRRGKDRVWLPFAGAVLAAVLASIFLLWMLLKPPPAPSSALPAEVNAETEIKALIDRLAAIRSADELLPLLRDPERHAGAVRAWCADPTRKLPPGGYLLSMKRSRTAGGVELATVTAALGDVPGRQVLCVKTPAGWRIDWLAFHGTADMSPAGFTAEKPAQPVLVLAVVQRSTYYNPPYTDQTAWLSLRVSDTRGENVFYAAVPRSDAAMMQALDDLPTMVEREGVNLALYSRRKALRLRFTHPELAPPVAEVTAVEGEGWFIP